MDKKQLVKWSISLSLLFLVGCTDSLANKANTEGNSDETLEEPNVVEIVDAAGNSVEVPYNPQRVAVFDNGQLDNMAVIGIEDRVVVTASPNLPPHLSQYSDIEVAGSFFEIDLEVTHAAEPDLIIVAGRSSAAYDELSSIAPTIDLTNDSQNYLDSIEQNLARYAQIFDVKKEVDEISMGLNKELDSLYTDANESELKTIVTMYNEGSLSAYGPGSRFGVVHDAFGFDPADENIESSNHGMEISNEYLLSENPDVIFVIDRTAAIGGDATSKSLEENPVIQETRAFQTDSIIYLSPAAWYLAEGGVETFHIMIKEVKTALD